MADAMARIKAEASLMDFCAEHLNRIGRTWECPACHSGTGPNHSPAFSIYSDGERWYCHSCNRGGDIFDLAGILAGTDDRAQQANAVAEWARVDGWGTDNQGEAFGWDDVVATKDAAEPTASEAPIKPAQPKANNYEEGRAKERSYVEAMRANIGHPDALAYLAARGIDGDTARAWGLGYDPNAGKAKRADGSWCERGRIVIPWAGSDYYHIDRAIAPDVAQNKYDKPRAGDVGPQPLWNPGALRAQAFYVVEGALDALAVQACGFEAVALGSAGGAALLEAMRAERSAGCALLLLDNDEPKADGRRPGQDAQAKLAADMEAAGLAFVSLDAARIGAKDAAEAWATDRAALAAALAELHAEGVAEIERRREERYAEALRRLRVVDAATIADAIADYTNPVIPVPTGFAALDASLGNRETSTWSAAVRAWESPRTRYRSPTR